MSSSASSPASGAMLALLDQHLAHRPDADRGERHQRGIGVVAAGECHQRLVLLEPSRLSPSSTAPSSSSASSSAVTSRRHSRCSTSPARSSTTQPISLVDRLAHGPVELLDGHRVAACAVEQREQQLQRVAECHAEQRRRAEDVGAAEVLTQPADGRRTLAATARSAARAAGQRSSPAPAVRAPPAPVGPARAQSSSSETSGRSSPDGRGRGRSGRRRAARPPCGRRSSSSRPSRRVRPARTQRVNARSREPAPGLASAAASSAAAPGTTTGGNAGGCRFRLRGLAAGDLPAAPCGRSPARRCRTWLRNRGNGDRVGRRHAVAQHLHRPERAEVEVALVGQRVVQRRRGVDDLGVQLVRGGASGSPASPARRGNRSPRAARPGPRPDLPPAARRSAGTRRRARRRRARGSSVRAGRRRRACGRVRPRPGRVRRARPVCGPTRRSAGATDRGQTSTR